MDTLRQIHRFSEIAEIRHLVQRFGYRASHMKISPGSLDVEAFEMRVDGCLLYRERFGCQFLVHGISSPEGYGVMLVEQGYGRFYGIDVSPKSVVLFPPGCEIDAFGRPGVTTLHFFLPKDRIEAAAAEWDIDLVRFSRSTVVEPGIDRMHHLQAVSDQVTEIFDNGDLSAWPRAEEDLVDTFLGLFDRAAFGERGPRRSSGAAAEHAVKVVKHICSDPPVELDFESLARDLGISRHHLNRCFLEHYEVSVHAFVRICRLHLTRELLLEHGSGMTVTEAAYSCGFNHLGRFSAEYKHLFSESPSETLLQAARGG